MISTKNGNLFYNNVPPQRNAVLRCRIHFTSFFEISLRMDNLTGCEMHEGCIAVILSSSFMTLLCKKTSTLSMYLWVCAEETV